MDKFGLCPDVNISRGVCFRKRRLLCIELLGLAAAAVRAPSVVVHLTLTGFPAPSDQHRCFTDEAN